MTAEPTATATARYDEIRAPTAQATPAPVSPRSERDLAILRSLARRIDPKDAGAHNNLGVVYYHKGLYPEAVDQLERALDLDPRMQVAQRNLRIAYFSTGYYEELVGELRAQLEREPADREARRRLARAYLYGGDPGGAIIEFRRLVQSGTADVQTYLQLARAERGAGDVEAAMTRLRRAAVMDPENAQVLLEIGELQYGRGLTHEAQESLEAAVRADAHLAQAHHLLAFVYGDLGDNDRAEASAKRASELNPSLSRAEANLSLDRYSEARYDELIGNRSPHTEVAEATLAHYNLGLAFRQRGLYDEAEREFALALERGEDALMVRQARAEMLLLQTKSADAAAIYEELLQLEPNSPKIWNERGVAAHQLGDLDAAENAYQRALALDGSYALALNNFGVVSHHRGRPEAAERAFRSALHGGRAPGDVWRNLALMLSRVNRVKDAVQAYRQALDLDPSSAIAWSGLGAVLMQMSRPVEAKTALMRAVEVDPNLAEARYNLGFALSALGDYQGALRETKRALELDPYMPMPRFRLLIDLQFEEARVLAPELDVAERIETGGGIDTFDFDASALEGLFAELEPARAPRAATGDPLANAREAMARGELDRAVMEAQRAIAAGGDSIEPLVVLGDLLLRQGLAGEALERYGAALGTSALDPAALRGPQGQQLRAAMLGRARALLDLDRVPDARVEAERLAGLAPEDVDAQRALADAYVRTGDARLAVQVLSHAREQEPTNVPLLTELGVACRAAGQVTAAEEALRRAVHLDDGAVAALTALAQLLAETGRGPEAREHLRSALSLLPSYGGAGMTLAELEWREGRRAEAIHVLVDLLTADPYLLSALTRLGRMLEETGKREEAVVAYTRVLRFQPGDADAAAGLARLHAMAG